MDNLLKLKMQLFFDMLLAYNMTSHIKNRSSVVAKLHIWNTASKIMRQRVKGLIHQIKKPIIPQYLEVKMMRTLQYDIDHSVSDVCPHAL